MSERDGGPAFPVITPDMPAAGGPGMSLRDWFAGMAMTALANQVWRWCAVHVDEPTDDAAAQRLGNLAYMTAEAMLAEREKVKP